MEILGLQLCWPAQHEIFTVCVIAEHHLSICPLVHLSSLLVQDPFFLEATRSSPSHFVYSSTASFPSSVFSSSSAFPSFLPYSVPSSSHLSQPPGCPQINVITSVTAAGQRPGLQGAKSCQHLSFHNLTSPCFSFPNLQAEAEKKWYCVYH